MAWSQSETQPLYAGCGYSQNAHVTYRLDVSGWVWYRDTNNCEYAKPQVDVEMSAYWERLGWASASGITRTATQCDYFDGNSGVYDYTHGKGGQCPSNPITYAHTHYGVPGHVRAGDTTLGYWFIWGFTPTSSGADWQWLGKYDAPLPTNMQVLPPEGLSVSFPSTLGGYLSASISKWSANTNIGGTPTSYPNAKYWNWAVDLLDVYGNYLAHKCLNTGESKYASWSGDSNFYTASTLYPSSYYSTQKNMGYKLKVVVNNNMNQQLTRTSNTIYTAPPDPTVTITSCVYNPSTRDCQLTFNWSKPSDGGALTETITYDLYDATGKYYKSGVTLATTSNGAAKSGTITVTGLPSGEQYTVKVTVSTSAGSAYDTDSTHAPVANAAFLGFDWDELRRTVVIRAEAPGAANCRLQAGDAPNYYNLGNKLTSGEIGTITLKDLPHGEGQALYLQAVPEASDGYQYTNEIAKVTVPVPNPILGLLTPKCEGSEEQRYIVDIVEKKDDCTVTPKWQCGDRVVVKEPCLSEEQLAPAPGDWGNMARGWRTAKTTGTSNGGYLVDGHPYPNAQGDLVYRVLPECKGVAYSQSQLWSSYTSFFRTPGITIDERYNIPLGWDLPSYEAGKQYMVTVNTSSGLVSTGFELIWWKKGANTSNKFVALVANTPTLVTVPSNVDGFTIGASAGAGFLANDDFLISVSYEEV